MSLDTSQQKSAEELKLTAKTLQRAKKFVDAIEDIERNLFLNHSLYQHQSLSQNVTTSSSQQKDNMWCLWKAIF